MAYIDETISHGVWRRVFDDCVTYQPAWLRDDTRKITSWDYAVFKFPFVPGFHVCYIPDLEDGDAINCETVMSTHKTLHEAMGVCKILLANGGVHYV